MAKKTSKDSAALAVVDRQMKIDSLTTGAHLILSRIALGDESPLSHPSRMDATGQADVETRSSIEDAVMYVRTAFDLLVMAQRLAFEKPQS